MRRIPLMILLIVLAVVFTSCISTSLVYSPAVHQTGRTPRVQDEYTFRFGAGLGMKRTVTLDYESYTVETKRPFEQGGGVLVGGELGVPLLDRLTVGAEAALGIDGDRTSWLGRAYGKIMLTPRERRFAVSVMPALVGLRGQRETDQNASIWSHATGFELHVPLSYRINRRSEWTLCPKYVWIDSETPIERHGSGSYHVPEQVLTHSISGPALGVGYRFGMLFPEATLAVFDEHTLLFVSLALRLN